MNKKGFTLIELLAVIVILAIIALIATPAVLNIIEDSRKGAAEASARNIVSAAKTYYMQSTMNGSTISSIDLSGTTLKYDGDQATKGYVIFDKDGKVTSKMYVNGYCVEIAANGDVTSEKMDEEDCNITIEETPVTYTKYNDGTPLLYDPVNNVKCTESEVETNVNNYKADDEEERIEGLSTGCMKWYAFLDSGENSTVNLLLDHSLEVYIAWNKDGGETPDTIMADLPKNWSSTPRLISVEEINQIAPFSSSHVWDVNDYNTGYYFHTGTTVEYIGAAETNKYAWLFDNTSACTTYGCYSDGYTDSYWTSSYAGSNKAWIVSSDGSLKYNEVTDDGIDYFTSTRPVITVDKSVFAQ